jgi:hypothetical protein
MALDHRARKSVSSAANTATASMTTGSWDAKNGTPEDTQNQNEDTYEKESISV